MDKKLVGLITVFLLVFGVFMTYIFARQSGGSLSIRANQSKIASCPNSFLFATNVDSNNRSETVTAYVRDDASNGLANLAFQCTSTLGSLSPDNLVTNKMGQASFTLSSTTPGVATVSCTLPCGLFSRSVTVKFN